MDKKNGQQKGKVIYMSVATPPPEPSGIHPVAPPQAPVPAPPLPTTWSGLIRNPVALLFVLVIGGGGTYGGLSLHEWAEAAKSLPEVVVEMKAMREEISAFRAEMQAERRDRRAASAVIEDALGVEPVDRKNVDVKMKSEDDGEPDS